MTNGRADGTPVAQTVKNYVIAIRKKASPLGKLAKISDF